MATGLAIIGGLVILALIGMGLKAFFQKLAVKNTNNTKEEK